MSNLKELLRAREVLERRIEDARQTEAPSALAAVRETVAMFRFTRTEVFGGLSTLNLPRTPPRFRNITTGETWNGRGPRPAWLRGKDIEQYRIGESG